MLESQRLNIQNLIEKATTERAAAIVSETFMLQNLSVIENQRAQLDILFSKSNVGHSPETSSWTSTSSPLAKTVSFCCVVDELLFDAEDPWESDGGDECDEYDAEDDNGRSDSSTESDSSDEDDEALPRFEEPLSHEPRWQPDFSADPRAPSLSLSPVARLMEAAAAKHSRTAAFRGADAR
jgi:hypothetical protein